MNFYTFGALFNSTVIYAENNATKLQIKNYCKCFLFAQILVKKVGNEFPPRKIVGHGVSSHPHHSLTPVHQKRLEESKNGVGRTAKRLVKLVNQSYPARCT